MLNDLKSFNADIISTDMIKYRIISIRIGASRLNELASLPVIEYVQPAPGGDQLLNYNSRYASRANLLNASITDGGKGLNGEGIVVGVGDNADVQTHIDFARRLINPQHNLPHRVTDTIQQVRLPAQEMVMSFTGDMHPKLL